MTSDEIQKIIPPNFPYGLDDKIFLSMDENGALIGEPFSYNDLLKRLENISGINEEFLGKNDTID